MLFRHQPYSNSHPNIRLHTFVPISHVIFPSCLILSFPCILIQILLLPLPLHTQVMAEFTLLSLFAVALLVEYAHDGFRIHPKRYFLYLYWLEEFGDLTFRSFGRKLLLLSRFLLCRCLSLLWGLGLSGLGFVKGDCFLRLSPFFL